MVKDSYERTMNRKGKKENLIKIRKRENVICNPRKLMDSWNGKIDIWEKRRLAIRRSFKKWIAMEFMIHRSSLPNSGSLDFLSHLLWTSLSSFSIHPDVCFLKEITTNGMPDVINIWSPKENVAHECKS